MYLTGVFFTLFLGFILLGKKERSNSDNILVIWLLLIGIQLSLSYLCITDLYINFPYLLGLEKPILLLHGPFLYLYTTSLTNQLAQKKYLWVHFLPFAAGFILSADFLTLSPARKIEMYQNKGEGYGMHVVFENIIYIISGITYVILTILVLKKHRKNIENKFSYLGKLNLTWLRYLIIGLCVIWLSFIVGDEYTFSTVVIYVFFIGYYGIQAGIFTQPQVIHAASKADFERVNKMASEAIRDDERIVQIHSVEIFEEENDSMTVKYKKSGLSDESANEIHKRLCALMAEKKLFKNPELSLTELALELNVNPNVLSQIINSIEQKNFYDYINELRVLEFKKFITLSENQKFTLLALAYECGFNSKTSFNRNFKKLTGISPTEYLAQMNTNLSNK